MRGHIPIIEGINAGASYSALQVLIKDGDVAWIGGATRVAKNLGVAKRADVQAIVDDANAQTAVLRNQVIGTQQFDIRRDPTRLNESAMGNMVADAMREKYPGVEAAITNSGGLRQDLLCAPPSATEANCEITWGEVFAVLPFGNRTTILTLTGAQLTTALVNGFSPVCDPLINTGRFPQVSGLKLHLPLQRHHGRGGSHREGPERADGAADARRADRYRPLRDERLHVHGRRRLHGLRAGHGRAAARRRPAAGRRSTTSQPTRPSARWSRGARCGERRRPHQDDRGGPAGAPALRRCSRAYAGGGEQSTVMLRSQPLPPSIQVTSPITSSPRRTRYDRLVAGWTA